MATTSVATEEGEKVYCHWEDWAKFESSALRGLYSSYITPQVIATTRITRKAIEEHHLLKQFNELDVRMIVNLQQPFENMRCADVPIFPETGFTYDLDLFRRSNVHVINPHWWVDNSIPEDPLQLFEIIKEMKRVVSEGGKVVVHCHAGLGRTGTTIAGFLMHHQGLKADEAVEHVRKFRPHSIIPIQRTFLIDVFELHIKQN